MNPNQMPERAMNRISGREMSRISRFSKALSRTRFVTTMCLRSSTSSMFWEISRMIFVIARGASACTRFSSSC